MLAEIVIHTPDGRSNTVQLAEMERVALGRSSSNELCFADDSGLSRQHLVFERIGGDWVLRDLGSKNGTFVNAGRITGPHVLCPGDKITAGHLTLDYQIVGATPVTNQTVSFVPDQQTPAAMTVVTDLKGVITKQRASADSARPSDSRSVAALIRAGQELSSHRPLNELFGLILDLAIETFGANRAVLMTLEEDKLVVRAAHGANFQISSTVRDRVIQGKESLLVQDAQFDSAFAGRQSIVLQGMRSIMAVPLQTQDRVIGLVYLDTNDLVRSFTADDLNLLTVLANVAAIRIEQARLAEVEQAERILARELAQAAEIQRGLLPTAAPMSPTLDIAGRNLPCQTVGGDYFDYLAYPDGRIGIVVADVAGKGMPAALMMSNMQALMQVFTEAALEPAPLITRLNRHLAKKCPGNRFITMFFGVLDPATGVLVYCNAGHNPPVLVRSTSHAELLSGGGGMILGIFGEALYEAQSTYMYPGDLLAMFSDGVTEACPPKSEDEFGDQRLAAVLAANRHLPSAVIVDGVLQELTHWTQGGSFADDVTLVVVRRLA
ncbi:MAG TPA: SpoIIE family protein phosphatase [Bryobacteraceae bacterium]|jgi:serine phosphatase RsbU (regulator of sigma subunit)|nr:SpoIIE family protein phosphatase [Bryobacteraceae bacterium]